MSIFKKKDEDDEYEYDDEELEELESRKPNPRKFKDLKPENKKKRKEPPKPWGRRERLIVFYVFLATVVIAAGLAVSARNWKLPGLPRISLPSFDFFKEETIIVGKKPASREDQEKARKAKDAFKETTRDLSGLYSFLIIDLEKDISYGSSETSIMQAASLIKLPTLVALYLEAEKGNIDLETKYTLKQSDKLPGSGSLSGKPAGTVLTYRDLARLMGKQSDNTAFGIIRRALGDEKINEVTTGIGMTKTSLTENTTTPEDIGLFFKKLWKKEIVSDDSRDEILGYLTDTIYENWIVAGVPDDIRVAHKYGRELHVVNDAGIVFSKYPFVLVIMADGVVEREADETIPKIAEKLFNIQTGKD